MKKRRRKKAISALGFFGMREECMTRTVSLLRILGKAGKNTKYTRKTGVKKKAGKREAKRGATRPFLKLALNQLALSWSRLLALSFARRQKGLARKYIGRTGVKEKAKRTRKYTGRTNVKRTRAKGLVPSLLASIFIKNPRGKVKNA